MQVLDKTLQAETDSSGVSHQRIQAMLKGVLDAGVLFEGKCAFRSARVPR